LESSTCPHLTFLGAWRIMEPSNNLICEGRRP
jgi:hypothetical protein